jgi:hypothetical protein
MGQNTSARSPNVGDIRWLGAKSVILLCQTCQHQQVASIELLPDDVPLALVASKFVCPQSHQEGAYVLPTGGRQRQLIRQHDEPQSHRPGPPMTLGSMREARCTALRVAADRSQGPTS